MADSAYPVKKNQLKSLCIKLSGKKSNTGVRIFTGSSKITVSVHARENVAKCCPVAEI